MSSFDVISHNGFSFYVIDDLKTASLKLQFQSLNEALERFLTIEANNDAIPALGVEKVPYCLDLIQRVNGKNVLVPDYKNENLSESMVSIRSKLDKLVALLKDEAVIKYTYCRDFFDRVGRSCAVVVPVGKVIDGFDDSYCADKRLKTVSGAGIDSINQLFVDGHGWVDYRDVREDPDSYCVNGVLCVESVNVNYTLKTNWTGIDGRMDISAHDFTRMLANVNKEFSLRVYDSRLDNSYVVGSYDDIGAAVKAWYELPADLTAQVNQTVGYSYQQIVFNGVDDNFDEISYEKAAEMYGFDADAIERLIADAATKSTELNSAKPVKDVDLGKI